MISVKIVKGSKNPFNDKKLITWELSYPRIIHAEVMTHKMLGKNAASSRAIPFSKNLESIESNMFTPMAYQKKHSGMQGNEYFTDKDDVTKLDSIWYSAFDMAATYAHRLDNEGVSKQICNRLLEPFQYINVLMSGTEWDNFFDLRSSKFKQCFGEGYWNSYNDLIEEVKDLPVSKLILEQNNLFEKLEMNKGMAELHLRELAEQMWDQYNSYEYQMLEPNQWHIPYEETIDLEEGMNHIDLIKISTAIAARGSYGKFNGKSSMEDVKLHDKLLLDRHMSPFIHCGKCPDETEYNVYCDTKFKGFNNDIPIIENGWFSEYHGFIPYRYLIERNLI